MCSGAVRQPSPLPRHPAHPPPPAQALSPTRRLLRWLRPPACPRSASPTNPLRRSRGRTSSTQVRAPLACPLLAAAVKGALLAAPAVLPTAALTGARRRGPASAAAAIWSPPACMLPRWPRMLLADLLHPRPPPALPFPQTCGPAWARRTRPITGGSASRASRWGAGLACCACASSTTRLPVHHS